MAKKSGGSDRSSRSSKTGRFVPVKKSDGKSGAVRTHKKGDRDDPPHTTKGR
jgi:hypothetical protein